MYSGLELPKTYTWQAQYTIECRIVATKVVCVVVVFTYLQDYLYITYGIWNSM